MSSNFVFSRGPSSTDWMVIGESPGCLLGSTLIDTCFRDKSKIKYGPEIKNLVGRRGYVYCYDHENDDLSVDWISKVWCTGKKQIYRVTFEWYGNAPGRAVRFEGHIDLTDNHPVIIKKTKEYKSLLSGLSVGDRLLPFSRHTGEGYDKVGCSYSKIHREARMLLGCKLGRPLLADEHCHHIDGNKQNDRWNNLELLSINDHSRLHTVEINPMNRDGARDNHKRATAEPEYRKLLSEKMKSHLSDPENYKKRVDQIQLQREQTSKTVSNLYADKDYYWRYLLGKVNSDSFNVDINWAIQKFKKKFPNDQVPDNHKIIRIERLGVEDVYDISTVKHHNFVANGIFAHNSTEFRLGLPFVGPSGDAQNWYFRRHGLDPAEPYVTNCVKEYTPGNPNPTEQQIDHWTPYLIDEIHKVRPKIIIAAGRFAARWLLGEETELEIAHGMPYTVGFYNQSRSDRAPNNTIIIPAYHPAAGFYRSEPRTLIDWDYKQAAVHLATLRAGGAVHVPRDLYADKETYLDVTGKQLKDLISNAIKGADGISEIGIDTETTPSIQVSWQDSVAYTIRACQPDFSVGISALQSLVNSGILVILHDAGTPRGCCYDMVECRKLGLELRYANLFNTMTALFKLRFESRSLKVAAERFLRCKMADYQQIIGDVGRQKAIDYLQQARSVTWPKTDFVSEEQQDGTYKLVKPKSVNTRIDGILRDMEKGKSTKDGPTDPYKRWKQVPKFLRKPVEQRFGPMPEGNLSDIPLEQSTYYASRDADVTRRLLPYLVSRLVTENPPDIPSLRSVFDTSNAVLPMFEAMQDNGIQGSKKAFLDFASTVTSDMRELRTEISTKFYSGAPFNPRSPVDVRSLMRRRGLEAELQTPSGDPSTSQDSIGHLIDDEAIGLVFDYREMATLLSNYVEPIIDIVEDEPTDNVTVHYWIKPVTVEHRRISTEKPNILATPSRSALAKKVRACYRVHDPSLCWIAVDFSGQEMRCAADLSQDPRLMSVFINGGDAHRLSAAYVYHNGDESLVTKEERRAAKTINFGILYGMAGRGLQKQMRKNGIAIDLVECQRLHRGVLRDAYPGIAECIEKVGRDAQRSGVVYDCAGMPRYLPQLWSKDQKEVAEAKRQAFSHKNSGTAQALTQHAMRHLWPQVIDIQRSGHRLDPVAQFHDELIFLTEKRIAPYVVELVKDSFVNHSDGEIGLTLSVPIEADGHIGDTWAQLK